MELIAIAVVLVVGSAVALGVFRSNKKVRSRSIAGHQAVHKEKLAPLRESQATIDREQIRLDTEKRVRTRKKRAQTKREKELRNGRRDDTKWMDISHEPSTYSSKKPTSPNSKKPSDYSRLYGRDSAWN